MRILSGWIFLALFCLSGIFNHSLWNANDAREGAMIAEMLRDGTWLLPTFNGQPYFEKPPLNHWSAMVLCRLAGILNEGMTRLPAALFGLGALLIIGRWGIWLHRPRGALAGAAMCATTALFFEYTRIVLTDAALTFTVALALTLFWQAYTAPRRCAIYYLFFLIAAALSFYAKGLLGPGLIWIATLLFLAWQRQWRLGCILALLFLPVALAIIGPWAHGLWRAGGLPFIKAVFWDNQFGRFLSFSDPALPPDPYFVHKEHFLYYVWTLPARLLPWTLLVAAALIAWFRQRPMTPPAKMVTCIIIAMALILQASSAKAACYLLPLFPWLFLVTGVWLADLTARGAPAWALRLTSLNFGVVIAALTVSSALYIAGVMVRVPHLMLPGTRPAVTGMVFALAALTLGAWQTGRLIAQWRRGVLALGHPVWLPLCAAAMLAGVCMAFMPAYDYQRTYRPLADLARAHRDAGGRLAMAGWDERNLGALMFYLDSRMTVLPEEPAAWRDFLTKHQPGAVILTAAQWAAAPTGFFGPEYSALIPNHAGYKAREFRLLTMRGDADSP